MADPTPDVDAPALPQYLQGEIGKLVNVISIASIVLCALIAIRFLRLLKKQEDVASLSASWIQTEIDKQEGRDFGDTGP